MAIVLASTTSSQADMDHAVSDGWREAPEPKPEPVPAPAPEEPPIDTPDEPLEVPEEPEAPDEPVEAKPKVAHKSGWQKRIDKLTARNHQLESRLAEIEARSKPAEEAKPAVGGPQEPKLADFGNDVEKFLAARDAWKENSARQEELAEQRKAIVAEYNKKASQALGEYDDWNEVVTSANVIVPQAAIDAIIESDNGPDVAYYLAKHQDEAQALNDMTSLKAIHTINRLSDKLIAEKAKPAPKAKVVPPAPITPITTSGTKTSTPLEKMSMREYIKVRNKQEREARRG